MISCVDEMSRVSDRRRSSTTITSARIHSGIRSAPETEDNIAQLIISQPWSQEGGGWVGG